MNEDSQPVRPLDIDAAENSSNPPPRLILVAGLLAIGALLGWIVASLGGDSVATASSTTDGPAALSSDAASGESTGPVINWQQATTLPSLPAGLEYAGVTDPVSLDRTTYLGVNFSDPETGQINGQLWSSGDGSEWQAKTLRLGTPTAIVELTAARDSLIMSTRSDNGFELWRSPLGRAVDGDSWTRLEVDLPDNVDVQSHRTTVSVEGETTTVLIGNLEIWREILAPYVPDSIDIDDPELVLFMGSVVRPGEDIPYPVLSFDPEVLTTRDSVWVRVVDIDGREELFTRSLPTGAYPLDRTPELGSVPVAFAWRSADGIDFAPITGRGALPDGYFLPEPWRGGFLAAAYAQAGSFELHEQVRLWSSESGRAWQPLDDQPPHECARYLLAVSGNRLLLSDGSLQCLWSGDAWDVLADAAEVFPVTGGPAGFVGYRSSFDQTSALFSRDGRTWVDAAVPTGEAFETLAVLNNGLFAVTQTQSDADEPAEIDIWIGEIE